MSGPVTLAELRGDDYVEERIRSELSAARAATSDPDVLRALEKALRSLIDAERGMSNTRYEVLKHRKALKRRYAS